MQFMHLAGIGILIKRVLQSKMHTLSEVDKLQNYEIASIPFFVIPTNFPELIDSAHGIRTIMLHCHEHEWRIIHLQLTENKSLRPIPRS